MCLLPDENRKCIVPSPVCTDRKSSECLELNLDLPQLVDPTPLALLSPPLLYQGSHSFYDSFPQAGTAHESDCLLSYFYFCCGDPWQQWGGKGYSTYSSRLQCITAGKSQERQLKAAVPSTATVTNRETWTACLSLLGSTSCLHSYRVQGPMPRGQWPLQLAVSSPVNLQSRQFPTDSLTGQADLSTIKAQFSGDSRLW